ncbi:hypothetical protein DU508_11410 [Pedobacter chinensis]|uniref:Glycosyltransferase subfamily 4-like N-terminal domain-containing protein n=1 Tax=Pedobacter chinensis TaxID=2282421 RepID=A0A369PU79_9SPHI|nr:glycosyltransferase [Pedobacter chinensis]RDC56211.1 hypothetical protein DU508_11410 [Pedobacter chinensis]
MRKLLIISPYFPPSNAADMQRIRTSLPYFEKFGWAAEVVCVNPKFSDLTKDKLLLHSVPKNIKIHLVNAFSKKITSKFGLGSIAIRSLLFYKNYVDRLLKKEKFDLIYFSTTQFPICILGKHWKEKFNIPYVIDMQDPWHSNYYQNKPKNERPKKYWFSYRLNKYLEPIALKSVDGLISVTKHYVDDLFQRYPIIKNVPFAIVPFGVNETDFKIADQYIQNQVIDLKDHKINIIYTGAVGDIMKESISFLCKTLAYLRQEQIHLYKKLHFYFIGTSYAPDNEGKATVLPIAKNHKVEDCVTERVTRIGYFDSLYLLKKANALMILGSDETSYNPSKIYTYISASKPLISIFKLDSPAVSAIENSGAGSVIKYTENGAMQKLISAFEQIIDHIPQVINRNSNHLKSYSAEKLTKKQCELFNQVIK